MENSGGIEFVKMNHIGFVDVPEFASGPEAERMLTALSDLCEKLGTEDDIRVVVINVEGHPLRVNPAEEISGAPVGEDEWHPERMSAVDMLAAIPQPVIVGLGDETDGLALEMMLACDLRIVAEESTFAFSHVSRGTIPRHGGTQRLARVVGKAKALELILTGEEIDAREAYRIGLVHKVIPKADLKQSITSLARSVADKSLPALSYAKEAVHGGMDLTLAQGLRLETDLYMLLHTSLDRTEGIRAFQEKRKARFTGK